MLISEYLVPHQTMSNSIPNYLIMMYRFTKDKFEWNKKKKIAFWRGTTTGGRMDGETQQLFPRHRMVYQYQNNSNFDVAFSAILQDECKEKAQKLYRIDQHRDYDYSMQYRYIIDLVNEFFSEIYNKLGWKLLYWTVLEYGGK